VLASLKEIIKQYQGKYESYLRLLNGRHETIIYLGENYRVELSANMKKDADRILGAGATRFI
jgi:hypothetical protein